MIHHPVLAMLAICLLILESYLEIRYAQAGFPKSSRWLLLLFCCGGGTIVCGGLALIPQPRIMFQNIGTIGSLFVSMLLGGIIATYTVPRYAQEALRNRQNNRR
jgi:hypothetical protein